MMKTGDLPWRLAISLAGLVALLAAWFVRSGRAAPKPPPAGGQRVLFLGNSLTSANRLPLIVEALAQAGGDRIETAAVAFGGFGLVDLWNEGSALREIGRGGWTVVVLQQGPSSLPENRADLRRWTKRWAERIRKVGARPGLYMVWPDKTRLAFFDAVSQSYALAAADVEGLLFPAGEAWREAWRRDPEAPLYGPDGFHPSEAGSYAAALAIYGVLSGRPLEGLPAKLTLRDGSVIEVPSALAATLQEAATEANRKFGKR
jgi:lysophospholipase L1-like esterase